MRRNAALGRPMPGPFIFIATNRLKPGKLAEEKARVPGLVDFIETNEPRLLAFNEFANEEGTEVAVVQVHPDADSMASHWRSLPSAPRRRTRRPSTQQRASRCSVRPATPSSRCCAARPEQAFR
jgi:hypothetical protein